MGEALSNMMTLKAARQGIGGVPWTRILIDYLLITLAAIGEAVGVLVFFSSLNIAPSGVSGISVLLNKTLGTPLGLMIFLMNVPIQVLAYRMMPGGWRIVVRTVYALAVYTLALDLLSRVDLVNLLFPSGGITDNALLGAIFGGITGGITAGIVIRAGGSFGGTSTLAIILSRRMGTPMSSTYLYTDTLVIGLSAFIFSWESALLAVVALFLSGMATDYILEGPSVIRTCVIITNKPQEVSKAIFLELGRGVTSWQATGMYTGEERSILYVAVGRSQVQELRRVVGTTDPEAFFVVGQGQTAYGEGFKPVS